MDRMEFEAVKSRLPEGWQLNEADATLLNAGGQIIVMYEGDDPMFRALVADAAQAHSMGAEF